MPFPVKCLLHKHEDLRLILIARAHARARAHTPTHTHTHTHTTGDSGMTVIQEQMKQRLARLYHLMTNKPYRICYSQVPVRNPI